MNVASEITETRIAFVTKDKNEVIIVTMKQGSLIDEYDVADYNLVIRLKSGGLPALKMVIAESSWRMTKKAKRLVKKEDTSTAARAIVIHGVLKASVLNLFGQFGFGKYPQRFFTDQDKAYAWLLKQK